MVSALQVHVCPETVLVTVRLAAHRADGLHGDAGLVVIPRYVHIE